MFSTSMALVMDITLVMKLLLILITSIHIHALVIHCNHERFLKDMTLMPYGIPFFSFFI